MIVTSIFAATLGLGSPVMPGSGMTYSSGGREADAIQQAIEKVNSNLQDNTQTFGLRNRILSILRYGLKRRFGINGWNGYKAKAVDENSIRQAAAFVKQMPFELGDPIVRVVPTGFVSFSWKPNNGRLCSVVFDVDGRYHCASIIGKKESALSTNDPHEVVQKALEVFA